MNRELKKKKVQKSSTDAKKVQRMNQMLMPVPWTGAAGVKQWGPKNKNKTKYTTIAKKPPKNSTYRNTIYR